MCGSHGGKTMLIKSLVENYCWPRGESTDSEGLHTRK